MAGTPSSGRETAVRLDTRDLVYFLCGHHEMVFLTRSGLFPSVKCVRFVGILQDERLVLQTPEFLKRIAERCGSV